MAVTIDPRPTYMGDRMIVTGTYELGDTSIDLSGLLASIDAVVLTPTAAPGAADPNHINAAGTGVTLTGAGATANGQFFAVGRRS